MVLFGRLPAYIMLFVWEILGRLPHHTKAGRKILEEVLLKRPSLKAVQNVRRVSFLTHGGVFAGVAQWGPLRWGPGAWAGTAQRAPVLGLQEESFAASPPSDKQTWNLHKGPLTRNIFF